MIRLVIGTLFCASSFFTHAQDYLQLSCDSVRFGKKESNVFIDLVSEKKIVGLGEATHGTSEFYKAKSEIIKLLVQRTGFKTLAIETGFDAYLINSYLTGKADDLAKPMRSFYLIYHTREFIELLTWLRNYNLSVSKEDQVTIYGIDNQHIGNLPDIIFGYLMEVDPVFVNEAQSRLTYLQDKLEPSRKHQYLDDIEYVKARVNDRKSIYLKHSTEAQWNLISRSLEAMTSAVQQSTMANNHGTKAQSIRDEQMLENVKWIINQQPNDAKIILWGHNGHVQKVNFNLKRKDHFRLGQGLHEAFDSLYYAVGFDFDKGSFNAVNYQQGATMQVCQVTNEKAGSFAAMFRHIPVPCYFFDFQSLEPTKREALLATTSMRESGIGFSGEQFTFANLDVKNAFDGMVFIKQTSATTFLDVRKVKQL